MTTLGATSSTTTIGTAASSAATDFATAAQGATADAAVPQSAAMNGQYKAGWYVSARITTAAAVAPAVNELLASPIIIPKACTVNRIGCEVTATAASSTVRLGIYSTNANGLPDALVLDAGTIDSAGSTGEKEITISQALGAGTYWLAGASQGGTPSLIAHTGAMSSISPVSAYSNWLVYPGLRIGTAVSGALPATCAVDWVRQTPRVWLRYA